MKKILIILLTVLTLLCIAPEKNVAYAKGNEKLTASSATTKDDRAAVDVELKENDGIWALKFKIGYDHSALKLESVKNGDLFSDGDVTMPDKLDKEEFVFMASSNSLKNIEGDGTVATFNFKAVDYAMKGKYPIKLTLIQAIDVDGNVIEMDTADGAVTVSYDVKKNDIVFDKAKNEGIKIPLQSKKKVNKVKINGKKIKKDSYTVDSDNNVVISPDYLNTLKDGKYSVKVETKKKNYIKDFFVKKDLEKEVKEKSREAKKSKATKEKNKVENSWTGQKSIIAIVIPVLALIIIAGVVYVLKKRRVNK
ncbi:cohesin domain-containing protein [Eubacterium sp.]|uniref:cohesin domain-containing protein n=1 Tax=Eubacterium sp. TaxID=142586 RepID=UPI00399456C0